MTCRIYKGDKGMIILCDRGGQSKRCSVCGRKATKLCDFPLRGKLAGKTCDKDLCDKCAVSVGHSVDYCPAHARYHQKNEVKNG